MFRGFRGEGIAIGAASRQSSEGSEGSARFQQAGSKGVVSPAAISFIVSVTGFTSRPPVHSEPQAKNLGKRRH